MCGVSTSDFLVGLAIVMIDLLARILSILAGRIVARAAQFLIFILVGRLLEPADVGTYVLYTTAIILAAQLGSLGLRQASAFWLGRNLAPPGQIVSNCLIICPVLAVIGAAIMMAMLPYPHESTPAIWLFSWLFLSLLGAMLGVLMQGILLGQGRSGAYGLADALQPLLLVAFFALVWFWWQITLESVSVSWAAAQVLAGLAAMTLAMVSTRPEKPSLRLLVPMVRHGLLFAINSFLIMFATRMSVFLVYKLASPAEAGSYFMGQRLGSVLAEAFFAAGLVGFSSVIRSDDPIKSIRRSARAGATAAWVFGALSLAVVPIADPLAAFLLGANVANSGEILAVTCLSFGPSAGVMIIFPALSAYGRPVWGLPAILFSIIVNFILCILLVPHLGGVGAAWALVVSQFSLFLGFVLVLRHRLAIPVKEVLIPRLN